MSIHLTAFVKSKNGHAADLKPLLLDLVSASRKEQACLQYDLHQVHDNENQFIFHEIWADQAGFDKHGQQEHIRIFGELAGPLLDGPILLHMTERLA